jgi:hypothetical protein
LFAGFLLPVLPTAQQIAEATTTTTTAPPQCPLGFTFNPATDLCEGTTATTPTPTADTTGPTPILRDEQALMGPTTDYLAVDYTADAQDDEDGTVLMRPEGFLVQDKIGGDIILSCNPPPGKVKYPVGDHTVTCSATDASGKQGTLSFTVSVPPHPAAAATSPAAPADPTLQAQQQEEDDDTTTTDEEGGAATDGEGTDPEPTDETTTDDTGGAGGGQGTDPEPTDETTTDDTGGGAADDSGGGGPDGGEPQ